MGIQHFIGVWWTLLGWTQKSVGCTEGSQDRRGVKLQGTKIVNMLRLGCNACQILPWVIRSKKLNYIKFIQCFVLEIQGQNNKRSLTFCTGVKLSSWFDFRWERAQINWIIELIQKRYSFTYLGSQEVVNQGVKGHYPYYAYIGPMVCGHWTLTPPLIKIRTLRYMKLYIF